ncbi:MAG TPA: serine protease [Verrucomicrobiae bacterium]|jgi:S1-C subfamily serine protease|nr:serine protease [Verrucomicrobiae bacterium]
MNHKLNLMATACTLLAVTCHADELADKGRDIFNKYEHAVVTVQTVLKMTDSRGGRSSNPSEIKRDLTGTVIDPSGLTVLALSSVDPAELYRRVSEEYNKIDTQINDVKLLLDDGTEVPSEIVLRDKDLDLVFIRPKAKVSAPMAAVDLSKSATVEILEPIVALNRLGRAAGRAYSASFERIDAVISKPRTFYIPSSGASSSTLGSPAFALNGNVVGIFVMRAVSAGDTGGRNPAENVTAILLPAEDILKGAKQAPEAKGDADKPADKPAGTTDQKDTKEPK